MYGKRWIFSKATLASFFSASLLFLLDPLNALSSFVRVWESNIVLTYVPGMFLVQYDEPLFPVIDKP